MRNIGKRLGAILLSALMVLSLIGVEPKEVSAEADSSYSKTTWGGGDTSVSIDIGVRFSLVNYNVYKAWQGGNIDTISSKKKLKMK